ncbi:MAG: hypothetical protein BGP04_09040 [Rhizobiales bacterium 62-17]|nr:MAG: hypothetical protein BGP04_09040 [Rhizobiales bacterium 62-17]
MDDDLMRIFASEGAARGQKGPFKAKLLRMDGAPGTEAPPYSFAQPAVSRPWLWLSLQVATIAVAAAAGWYSAGGRVQVPAHVATEADMSQLGSRLAAVEREAREREATLRQQHAADLAAVRKLIEGVGKDMEALRNGQRLVQAQRDETSLKLTQLTERLDKLEAAQITTGSIPHATPQAQAPGAPQRSVTAKASPPAPAPRSRPGPPPGGYVLGEVREGGAVVHGHRGPVDVAPGTFLPGAGRVQAILRRNGQWVVTTTNGEIDAEGY